MTNPMTTAAGEGAKPQIMCCSKDCKSPAVYAVNWPGQPNFMCDPCTQRARGLASFMGFILAVSRIPTTTPTTEQP